MKFGRYSRDQYFIPQIQILCSSNNLKRTTVAESEFPWFHPGCLVDGIQVGSGIQFRLTTREEDDAWLS